MRGEMVEVAVVAVETGDEQATAITATSKAAARNIFRIASLPLIESLFRCVLAVAVSLCEIRRSLEAKPVPSSCGNMFTGARLLKVRDLMRFGAFIVTRPCYFVGLVQIHFQCLECRRCWVQHADVTLR